MQPNTDQELEHNNMAVDETVSQHLVYTDDKHQAHMLHALNMMRKNKHFCDVILHVGSTEFHAHRCVLASVSPYLLELFTTDQDNNQRKSENVITYKLNGGFDKLALQTLIDYMYTSKLDVPDIQVKSVYLAARQLKMERVAKQCMEHLVTNLSIDNCIEIRSLPGIVKNEYFVQKVDQFIASHFGVLSKSNVLLSLSCSRIEVLNQTKQEMDLGTAPSICRLVLDWIKRQINDETLNLTSLFEKTHMLYLALDNSLQDCTDLPSEDVSNTDIVQDYKKLSKKNAANNSKTKRKCLGQPTKPRVLIYSRDIGESDRPEGDTDWNLIASSTVGEHTFLALVTLCGHLTTMSVQLRLNLPQQHTVQTPNGTRTPPEYATSGPSGSEGSVDEIGQEPDLYCALSPMSSAKCAMGCGQVNNSLLVCGGYDRVECLRTVEKYSPATNTWETLPNMKECRGRFQIAIVDGRVYAIGGSNGSTELNSVEMLDDAAEKWMKITPLPLARSNIGVCDLAGKIYCIGGWNGQAGIKQCDVLDPVTKVWESIAPLNTGRYQAGVTAFNNLLYAVGGCDSWNCLNSVEVYNPSTNVWQFSVPLNTPRRGCGAVVFKNKLYAIGGSDGTHSLNSTEIFDETSKSWTVGPSMTTPRANVGVAVVGGKLYAIGGFTGKTFINTIEYLDENSNEWTTFVPTNEELGDNHDNDIKSNGDHNNHYNENNKPPSVFTDNVPSSDENNDNIRENHKKNSEECDNGTIS